MAEFFHYCLRTTDVPATRAFYATVLGPQAAEIYQLHEQAVARGARPHWLGFLHVPDVGAAVATFRVHGATSLGAPWVNPQGIEAAVMRDPAGSVVALAKPARTVVPDGGVRVAWHLLHANDVARAKETYRELVGWHFAAPLEVSQHGVFHPFSYEPGGSPVGAIADIAGRPSVHPHWLFHFAVPELDTALAAVRAGGGTILGPFVLPSGDRVAVCDDAQGAAFALFEDGNYR